MLPQLITTVVGVVLTVVLFSTPWGTNTVVGYLWWCLHGSPFTCGVLCPLLTLASVVLAWTLLPGQSSGAPLEEWIPLCVLGIDEEPDGWIPYWEVPIRGMSDMGRDGVSVWHTGLLMEARVCDPWDSGAVAVIGASTLLLHGGSQCLTHVTYGKSTRIGGSGDTPGK